MTMERVRTARRLMAATAMLGAVAIAGCGGSDDKKQDPKAADEAKIRTVLRQLQEASVAGDGNRICNQIFTPKLADSVTKASETGSCANEVKRNLFSPTTKLTVQTVNVADAANATATVKEANGKTSNVFFVRQSGIWRIRSVQPA